MEVTYSSENDPGVAEHVDAVINPETCPSTTTGHKKTQAIRQQEYRLRMKEKSGPKKQKEDRPAKKSAAERQRECRLRKKLRANQNINAESNSDVTEILPRQDAGPSNYLTSVTTAQVVPSSPDDGPVITHHEVVIETAPVSTKKRQNVQQHESVSDVYKKKRKPNQTRNLNFDEICQLPSQPILTPRLLTNEMEILQPAENEFIENEDNINMSEESTSEPNSSLPYLSYQTHKSAHKLFKKKILQNSFGHACNVCDRLWFLEDLKCGSADEEILLKRITNFTDVTQIMMCKTCRASILKGNIPFLATYNGFKYPQRPVDLPELDIIAERLISPRLPFMQIRRLRHFNGQFAITGQIINVPVSVDNMIKLLPRPLDGNEEDYCINVHIKKKLIHKTSYLHGLVKGIVIKKWLTYLIETPLYKHFQIKVDDAWFTSNGEKVIIDYTDTGGSSRQDDVQELPSSETANHTHSVDSDSIEKRIHIDDLSEHIVIDESLTAQQQTLMWSEDKFLQIAPGENKVPESLLFDTYAEELSFPAIYLGEFRVFREEANVTPFMMATSELRRSDRRGVLPNKLLYTAMKIMRLRVCSALKIGFKHIGKDTNISKERVLSDDYINACLETNLAFMKSIPNSATYWSARKRDLFAMMRQLGRPTMFLTISANEIGWPNLLRILHKLKNQGEELTDEQIEVLNYFQKTTLINDDAVTCAIYFNKLINVIMLILQSKKLSPFGKYRVSHYFKRIEFQHRGSPHAHILLLFIFFHGFLMYVKKFIV